MDRMLKAVFGAPLAFLYGIGVDIRNKFFDLDIIKGEEFDIPIVCVGNITVGGTGKTPVTEYLIEVLSPVYNVAVLSRGYKRNSKGFVLASARSSFRDIGDEPKQIKLKYPEIPVAVCKNRVEGIKKLREQHPEINLIILDDAFQYRYLEPWVNIVLMDYNNPIYRDHLLPWGRLRDRRSQLDRANIILVTKCPVDMTPLDTRLVKKYLSIYPYQSLFFTRMKQGGVTPLFPDLAREEVRLGSNIIVMSGIAEPSLLVSGLKKRYRIIHELFFRDHHAYTMKDMLRLLELLGNSPEDTVIITTEKDAVKLTNRKKIPAKILERLYYIPIKVVFADESERDFLNILAQYVKTNHKYSVLNPE